MKKFKGIRPQEDIVRKMKKHGFYFTTASQNQYYNHHSDYNGFVNFEKNLFVMINVFNGDFWVNNLDNEKIADTHSDNLDNEKWYNDMLQAIYMPLETIEISDINNVEDIRDYLISSSHDMHSYYYMDDEYSNNPEIRILEDWEIKEDMHYSFEKVSEDEWRWKYSDELLTIDDMAYSIFNVLEHDYFLTEQKENDKFVCKPILRYSYSDESHIPIEKRDSRYFYFELRSDDEDITKSIICDGVQVNNEGSFIADRDILDDAIKHNIIYSRDEGLYADELNQLYDEIYYDFFLYNEEETEEELDDEDIEDEMEL